MNESQVCIIGAGLAGALISYRLAMQGITCLLLEAGPRYTQEAIEKRATHLRQGYEPWELPRGHPSEIYYDDCSDPTYPLQESIVKAAGGSTLAWLGTSLRLHPEDMKMRTLFGVGADWPLRHESLVPYYTLAERELGVAGDSELQADHPEPYPLPPFEYDDKDNRLVAACSRLGFSTQATPQARNSKPFDGRPICTNLASCIPLCPSNAKYTAVHHLQRAEETGLAHLICDAPVVKLKLWGSQIISATYFHEGKLVDQEAKIFVLCANAIETSRLLLLSDLLVKSGRQRRSRSVLGRFFMDHPLVVTEGLVNSALQPRGYQTLQSQHFYSSATRSHEAAFKLEFSTSPQFSWEMRRNHAERRSWLKVIAMFEMLPREHNFVGLSGKQTDNLRLPTPLIRLKLGEYESAAIKRAQTVSTEILKEAGASKIDISGPFWGAAHPSGTCRMGTDPTASVVRTDMRSHDIENLYIVGSSVFPTIGAANPSLTIAALALMVGDTIAQSMTHKNENTTI